MSHVPCNHTRTVALVRGVAAVSVAALMLIPSSLRSLVNIGSPLQQGVAAGQSVFEILDTPTEGAIKLDERDIAGPREDIDRDWRIRRATTHSAAH